MGKKKEKFVQSLGMLNPLKTERRFKYFKKIKLSQKHSKKNDIENNNFH